MYFVSRTFSRWETLHIIIGKSIKLGLRVVPPSPGNYSFSKTRKMNKNVISVEKNRVDEPKSSPGPSIWYSIVRGVFGGLSTVIRPKASFYYSKEVIKSDGTISKTVISYKQS
jgi:hypothetical protein